MEKLMKNIKLKAFMIAMSALFLLPLHGMAQLKEQHNKQPENFQEVSDRLDFLYGSHIPYQKFLKDFQIYIHNDERQKVAAMIHYPIKINVYNQRITFTTAQQLLLKYDDIFDPMLKQSIRQQSYGNLFANSKGIMIGENGELWFSGLCLDKNCKKINVKIIAINK
ncbi:MAG: hypothetical protein QM666_06565 [Acinetobacter sp.]